MLLDHWKIKDVINNRKEYVNQIKHRVLFTEYIYQSLG